MTLIGAGVALAYADRDLVPASSTGWTVTNLSGQVVNAAVLLAGLVLGLSGFSDQYARHALVADLGSGPAGRAAAWLFNVIWVLPVAMLAFVLLLFPTGHVRSRRWRLAGWFIGGVFTLATVWAAAPHPTPESAGSSAGGDHNREVCVRPSRVQS